MENRDDFENAIKRMDDAYYCMKTYLRRREEIGTILAESDDFHDESIGLLNDAYNRSDELLAKYKAMLYAEIAMLDDEIGEQ